MSSSDYLQRPEFVDLGQGMPPARARDFVPQVEFDKRRNFATVVHFNLLGKHHSPAPLGLDTSHGCDRRWITIAATVAMGHLIKAIFRGYGPDLNRLKQNVIAWISGHWPSR